MPIDIVIYAVVAAVMVFWLRSVIGTRHGEERERPNPFEVKSDNTIRTSPDQAYKTGDLVDTVIPSAQGADAGLVQIALVDKTFDIQQFNENAKDAFIIIVTAFAEGDKETLRDLCTDDVYQAFAEAIDERIKSGETVSTDIHSVRKIDIVRAGVENKRHAFVTMKITAEETYVIRDAKGTIIAGHPDRVTEMTDQWTFARDVKSRDPRWLLSKTEDGEVEEDGKTPLPDAG